MSEPSSPEIETSTPDSPPAPPPISPEKQGWLDHITRLVPDALAGVTQRDGLPIYVNPTHIKKVIQALRDDSQTQLNLLLFVAGADYPADQAIDVLYQLTSVPISPNLDGFTPPNLTIKCRLDRQHPELDSIYEIHTGVDWHERETWEMYGVNFVGHPELKHLLLYDGFKGYPLRKDYSDPLMLHLPPALTEA